MINRKNLVCESGYSNPFVLALIAIAICAVLVMGAAAMLAPVAATSDTPVAATTPSVSTNSTTTYGNGSTGYFPDQFVNQAKEIEPMPPTF